MSAKPLIASYWTLPMAVTWIAAPGDFDEVSKLAGDHSTPIKAPVAWAELCEAVQDKIIRGGRYYPPLETYGVKDDKGASVPIPSDAWTRLQPAQEEGQIVLRPRGGEVGPRYSSISVCEKDVLERWPPITEGAVCLVPMPPL